MRYIAYVVDLFGVAQVSYEFECASDDEAKGRAEEFLETHPAIELWKGAERVARLTREKAEDRDG